MVAQQAARPAQQKPGNGGGVPARPRVFRSGVQNHHEPLTIISGVPGTSPIPFQYDVPAYGFLRGVYLLVNVTGGVGSGTAAVYRQDSPWTWIQTIQFNDVNSTPIIFQITGPDLKTINKFGGYDYSADPQAAFDYTQGGTGGNSVFKLRIPLELRSRDCLGALPNKNNATAYKILGSIAPLSEVFSTNPAPTTPTNITLRVVMDAWWEPERTDLKGRPQADVPPGNNTTQYWAKQTFTNAAGSITNQIKRVGYLYRSQIFIQRDQSNPAVRSNTIFPDPLTYIYEGQNLTILPRDLLTWIMQKNYGYNAGYDTANGLDTGVYVINFNQDFGLQPGDELANGYLPTTSASRVELQGSISAAGFMTVLTNDVAARDELEIAAA